MKFRSLKMLLITVLTMTLLAVASQSPVSAQGTQTSTPQPAAMKVLQNLDDGSRAIAIDGQRYLAITRQQLDAWQKLQIDYDGLVKLRAEDATQIATLQHKWELAAKDTETAGAKADSYKADFELAREDAKRNFGLFMSERALRVEAQQFIPHTGGNGALAKLLDLLDRPAVQAGFKLGIPLYQTWKCS